MKPLFSSLYLLIHIILYCMYYKYSHFGISSRIL